jgi:hypothetical protein
VSNWKAHGTKKIITDKSKSWKINFNKIIDVRNSIDFDLPENRENVFVSTDPNGTNILEGVSLKLANSGKSIIVNYDNKPIWEKGKTYYLFIQNVKTIDGEVYKTPLRMEFGIK